MVFERSETASFPFLGILSPDYRTVPQEQQLLFPNDRILAQAMRTLYTEIMTPDRVMLIDWSNPYPTGIVDKTGHLGRFTGAEQWVHYIEDLGLEPFCQDYNDLRIPYNWQFTREHWRQGGLFEYQVMRDNQITVEYYGDRQYQGSQTIILPSPTAR